MEVIKKKKKVGVMSCESNESRAGILRRLPSVWPLSSSGGQKSNNCIFRSCSMSSQDCHKHEEYEMLSDLPESVVFYCRLGRGAEGWEAGWRVAVNEYMHTSFTEASFPYQNHGFDIHQL